MVGLCQGPRGALAAHRERPAFRSRTQTWDPCGELASGGSANLCEGGRKACQPRGAVSVELVRSAGVAAELPWTLCKQVRMAVPIKLYSQKQAVGQTWPGDSSLTLSWCAEGGQLGCKQDTSPGASPSVLEQTIYPGEGA